METLPPTSRDKLRRVLVMDHADRDAIAQRLLRFDDGAGSDWADLIDLMTLHPELRRQVVRLLAEIDAAGR